MGAEPSGAALAGRVVERGSAAVLLARAPHRRALVLDEPTTAWTRRRGTISWRRVRQIAREGTTLILITHHIDEIVPEIQHVVLLGEGRIVTAGPKTSVLTSKGLGASSARPS
jgi:iron complex transport system ATP-binding protein